MSPKVIPDHTAVRTALWRALHTEIDKPAILEDTVGLRMAAPNEDWRTRGDMHPMGTRGYRASIVGRARFIEDLVLEKQKTGVRQYVILGAGLDSFAQRHPSLDMKIFEIDQPETQAWKRARLGELGYGIGKNLCLVPVDFEKGESWRAKLSANGFDAKKPAVITSTGVTMYLTHEANFATLKEIASMAPGTTLALTFMIPLDMIPEPERAGHQMVYEKAAAAGTPFLSFFRPEEMVALAKKAGFKEARHASRLEIIDRYFKGRADGLEPSSGEEFLVATT